MTRPTGLAAAALIATSVVIGWPMFSREGAYYLDNPAHIAEVISLAHTDTGWSDIAICGFPLAVLHSPLWYGLLAWLTRVGLPPELPYLALLGASFVAPALAALYVLQRRMPLWAAFALAYGLLVYRGAAIGSMAALGGMFTFYFACAALILLADRLARPQRSLRDAAAIAALTGLIGISHTYVTLGVVALALVHGALRLSEGKRALRVLIYDAAAFALGGVAAARYVLLAVASGASAYAGTENLAATSVLRRLIAGFGVPPTAASALGRLLEHKTLYTDSLLQITLTWLGVYGAGLALRVRSRDRFAALGLGLAVLLLGLLLGVLPGTSLQLLGPQSFRLTYVAKLGLLFAAAPLAAAWAARRPLGPRGFALLCAACVLSGAWWQRSVAQVVPERAAVAELERFWQHMRPLVRPSWGRVYVQDPFDTPGTGSLFGSHATALTRARTGAKQLGAHYGVMPFATRAWTNSERGALFGREPAVQHVLDAMQHSNATHLLLVDAALAQRLASDGRLRPLLAQGRYTLLERVGAIAQPIAAGTGVQLLGSHNAAPGRMEIQLAVQRPGGSAQLREAYSPFWRLSPAGAARLVAEPDGLMSIRDLPTGVHALQLAVVLPRLPGWLTLFGWVSIVTLAACSWGGTRLRWAACWMPLRVRRRAPRYDPQAQAVEARYRTSSPS